MWVCKEWILQGMIMRKIMAKGEEQRKMASNM
jgi:hypothetical protein